MSSAVERALRLAAESKSPSLLGNLLSIPQQTKSRLARYHKTTKTPKLRKRTRIPKNVMPGGSDLFDIRAASILNSIQGKAYLKQQEFQADLYLQDHEYSRKEHLESVKAANSVQEARMKAGIAKRVGNERAYVEYLKQAAILQKKYELSAEDRASLRNLRKADTVHKTALTQDLLTKDQREQLKRAGRERLENIKHKNAFELEIYKRKQNILQKFVNQKARLEIESLKQKSKQPRTITEELDAGVQSGSISDVRGIATFLIDKKFKGESLRVATELYAEKYKVAPRKGLIYDDTWESYMTHSLPIEDIENVENKIENAKKFGSRYKAEEVLSSQIDYLMSQGQAPNQADIDEYARILNHAYPEQQSYFNTLRQQSKQHKIEANQPKTNDFAKQADIVLRGLYQQMVERNDAESMQVLENLEGRIKQIRQIEGGNFERDKLRSAYDVKSFSDEMEALRNK